MFKTARKAFVTLVTAGMLASAAIVPAQARPMGGFHGGGMHFHGGGMPHAGGSAFHGGFPRGPGPALHGGLHRPPAFHPTGNPYWHGGPPHGHGHGHGGPPHGHGGPHYGHGGPHHGHPPPPYRPYPVPYPVPAYGGPYGPYGPGWYGGPYWNNWGPALTFGAGALIGGGVAAAATSSNTVPTQAGINPKHYQWCEDHYKSYRASDNTYQPYHGPRKQCTSPYY
ncbi:UNVERIFIED_ORG: BA14K-like protein [Martelella mediterranea]